MKSFDQWFATYLEQPEPKVAKLLQDGTATRFLIAWSLFESKCFSGYVKKKDLLDYAKRTVQSPTYNAGCLRTISSGFHIRYQDKKLYKNLMHKDKSPSCLEEILGKQFDNLQEFEVLFLLLYVVYRYRNNIFHGNKGVQSWLKYELQIKQCIEVMQALITLEKVMHN